MLIMLIIGTVDGVDVSELNTTVADLDVVAVKTTGHYLWILLPLPAPIRTMS